MYEEPDRDNGDEPYLQDLRTSIEFIQADQGKNAECAEHLEVAF